MNSIDQLSFITQARDGTEPIETVCDLFKAIVEPKAKELQELLNRKIPDED